MARLLLLERLSKSNIVTNTDNAKGQSMQEATLNNANGNSGPAALTSQSKATLRAITVA